MVLSIEMNAHVSRCRIRAAQTLDARTRRLSGRTQISREGARLLDGLPYGSRRIRRTARPPIQIPPPKRRRLSRKDEDADDVAAFADERTQKLVPETHSVDATSSSEDLDYDSGETSTSGSTDSDTQQSVSEHGNISDEELTALTNVDQVTPQVESPEAKGKKQKRVNTQDPDDSSDSNSSSFEVDGSDSSAGSATSSDPSENAEDDAVADAGSQAPSTSSETSSSSSSSSSSSEQPIRDETTSKSILKLRSATAGKNNNEKSVLPLTGFVHPSLAKKLNFPILSSPPGLGNSRTHARNQRRKANKKQRWLQREALAANNDGADMRLTPRNILKDKGNDIHIQSDTAILTEGYKNAQAAGDLAGQPQENSGDDGLETEVLRSQLLRQFGESSSVEEEEERPPLAQGPQKNGRINSSGTIEEEARPSISAGPGASDHRHQDQATPVATTSRRLRIGEAGRRIIRSSIASTLPGKKQQKPVEPIVPEPPTQRKWQDVIKVSVVECGPTAQDFEFEPPPFPFKQYWHGTPHSVMKKRRAQYLKPIHEKYAVSQTVGEKRKRESEDFVPFYEEDGQENQPDSAYDPGDAGLNYDDEDASGDSHTLKGPSTNSSGSMNDDQKDIEEGYPRVPFEAGQLKPLSKEFCKAGTYIYFKRLEIFPSSGTPEIVGFRTAQIVDVAVETLELKLARRDVLHHDEKAEEKRRQFNVGAEDMNEHDEDEGRYLTAELAELIDAFVINAP